MSLDNILSIKETKEKFLENIAKDEKYKGKIARLFFAGKELKDDYKIGSIFKHHKIDISYGCVFAA